MEFINQLFFNKLFLVSITMIIVIIAYLNMQNFKDSSLQKGTKNDDGNEKKQKLNNASEVTQLPADENIAIQKMQAFLDKLPDVSDEDALLKTNEMLSETFEEKMNLDPNLSGTFNLKLLKQLDAGAEKKIKLKFGDAKGAFVNRIDSDGKIIIDFDTIEYIVGKHEPLIMPDGSVRVLNLLKLDDEVLLNIKHKKPIFCFDENKQSITKLTEEQIANLLVTSDEVINKDTLIELKEQNVSLLTSNDDKNIEIQEKDDEILSLKKRIQEIEIELKVYKENLNISSITPLKEKTENTQELKHKERESSDGSDGSVNKIEKVEENKTPEIKKEKLEEVNNNAKLMIQKEESLLNDINSAFDEANSEDNQEVAINEDKVKTNNKNIESSKIVANKVPTKETKETKDDSKKTLKKINGRTIPKIKKDFLNEFNLLSNENMTIGNKSISELMFISMKDMKSNEFILYFKESVLLNVLKKYLIENEYDVETEIDILIEKLGFKTTKGLYFFNNKKLKEIYKTNICSLLMPKEKLFGMSVKSKYSNCFTLEELNKEKEKAINTAKKTSLMAVLADITDYKFSEV